MVAVAILVAAAAELIVLLIALLIALSVPPLISLLIWRAPLLLALLVAGAGLRVLLAAIELLRRLRLLLWGRLTCLGRLNVRRRGEGCGGGCADSSAGAEACGCASWLVITTQRCGRRLALPGVEEAGRRTQSGRGDDNGRGVWMNCRLILRRCERGLGGGRGPGGGRGGLGVTAELGLRLAGGA